MMFALDFVLGLILGAAITALAAMALFSYREYQRETAAEIEKLNKKLENSTAAEIVEFKVKADQLQKDFKACMKCIEDMYGKDLGQASKMAAALKRVMQAMMREAEDAES